MVKRLFLFLAITAGLLTSCKDYDDDIDRLDEDIAEMTSTLSTQSSAITAVQSAITTQIASLKTQLEAAILAGDNAAKADAAAAMAKAVAVQTAVTNLTATVTTVQTELATKASKADLDAAVAQIAAMAAQIEAINTTIASLDVEALNNHLAEIDSKLSADALALIALEARLTLQEDALEAFKALVNGDHASINLSIDGLTAGQALLEGDIAAINTQITAILTDIAAIQASLAEKASVAEVEAAVDALEGSINGVLANLNVLKTSVNAMITNITLLNSLHAIVSDDEEMIPLLRFTTTVAKQTLTFAPNVTGAVSFVNGERLLSDEASIVVQVSPANADLSQMLDQIYLVDSKANAAVNDYIQAVSAERYTELFALRGAPTATGLWKITFRFPAESNFEDLQETVVDHGDPIAYAVAIENKVAENEADRHVVSEFACFVDAEDQDGIGELGFEVKGATASSFAPHTDLRNRYGVTESGVPAPVDYKWANASARLVASAKTEDDDAPSDIRSTAAFNFVEAGVNKSFYVRLNDEGQDDAYAYYITLDKDWAVESSPSEINAWNSYSYVGLNQIYKADETAELKITTAAADGDIIGFRVFAVNADGTLVDPDGKSFYVYVGDLASSALAFQQTFTGYITAGTAVPSNILAFAPSANLANVVSAEFTMTIGTGALDNTNLQLLDASNAALGDANLANWTNVKKLRIIGVDPARMEENKSYTGTLILRNNMGVAFSQTMITFGKVMPTFTPGAAIAYKTNVLHDGVIFGYPVPANTYNLTTAFNIDGAVVDVARLTVTNNTTVALKPNWTGTVADVADAIVGSSTVYDLTLGYNYGYILFNGNEYSAPWSADPAIKVQFHSYIQDLTGWRFTTAPALQYATDATFNVANIKAMPPAGSEINMTQNEALPANLQDLRSFTITGVKLLTGTTYTTVNEYFIPTFDPATETISFAAVITSPPAAAVASKLQLKLTDDFGHEYTFTIPASFNMVLN